MVKEGEEKEFLTRRIDRLKAYKDIIFQDGIFIIAQQIIAIYEDWLHIIKLRSIMKQLHSPEPEKRLMPWEVCMK